MKKLLIAIAVTMSTTACAGGGGNKTTRENDIIRLTNQINRVEQNALTTYDELRRQLTGLRKEITTMDGRARQLESAMADLEIKMRSGGGTSKTVDNGEKPVDPLPTANAIEITQKALKNLRDGQADIPTTIKELLPIGKEAAPLVVDELKRSRFVPKYADKLITLIATLPVDAIRGPVAKAAKDDALRQVVARVIGKKGDNGLSKVLEEYVGKADEDDKLVLATALTDCKNPAGLTPLVSLLASDKWDVRYLAFTTLKNINKGVEFEYNFRSSAEENKDAIEKWVKWNNEMGQKIFEE